MPVEEQNDVRLEAAPSAIVSFFLKTVVCILAITALGKTLAAAGTDLYLNSVNPIFPITNRLLYILSAQAELIVAAFLLFTTNANTKLFVVLWLSVSLLAYRMGLYFIDPAGGCSCLGSFENLFPQSFSAWLMRGLLAWMVLGSGILLFGSVRDKRWSFQTLSGSNRVLAWIGAALFVSNVGSSQGAEYEASGEVRVVGYDLYGKVYLSSTNAFRLTVIAGRWLIDVPDMAEKTSTDGVDVFTAMSLSNLNSATIAGTPIPTEDASFISQFVWHCLASADFYQRIPITNMPPFWLPKLSEPHGFQIHVSSFLGERGLPETFFYTSPGFFQAHKKDEVIIYPAPFDRPNWVIGKYHVLEVTNFNGMTIPMKGLFERWTPILSPKTTNDLALVNTWAFVLTNLSNPSTRIIPPAPLPKTSVMDERLATAKVPYLLYYISDGKWKATNDAFVVEKLRARTASVDRAERLRQAKLLKGKYVFIAILTICALPALWITYAKIKHRKEGQHQ